MAIATTNPATGETVREFDALSGAQLGEKLQRSQDEDEKLRFADGIESGMVYINKITESTPEVPFGGARNSGYGRELAGFGPQSFVNATTVWIQ